MRIWMVLGGMIVAVMMLMLLFTVALVVAVKHSGGGYKTLDNMINKMAVLSIAISGILAVLIPNVDCVKIVSFDVPAAVEAGSDNIVLDCDFEYKEEEKTQLVIKWYFNNEHQPIYQWIPSYKGPQLASELLKGHLDLQYEINEDSFKKHRALHIKNPLPQFSGTYMCKVSSFVDEDFKKKELLIYVPPSSLTLNVIPSEDEFSYLDISDPDISESEVSLNESGSLNVTCTASGMYPMPNAWLSWGQNSSEDAQHAVNVSTLRDDGLTDVSLFATIDNDQLDNILVITCTVSLPGTDFSVQEQTIFYPKGMEPTSPPDADEALEEIEMHEIINDTFVDDNNTFSDDYFASGEESSSGEFSGSGDESGWGEYSGSGEESDSGDFNGSGEESGWRESFGSGEINYDPLCDESGSGVCVESSGWGEYSGSGEESDSGDFNGSGEESGWREFSGSGVISYDPLCDESGSGVCLEGSGWGEFSGSGEESDSGDVNRSGEESGWRESFGSGEINYDPLCDESGSGVCVESSGWGEYSGSGEELDSGDFNGSGEELGSREFSGSGEIIYDPLCDEVSGSGECQEGSAEYVIVVEAACEIAGDCAKNVTVTVETELVKIEQDGSEGRDELGEEEEDGSEGRDELTEEKEEDGNDHRDKLAKEEEDESKGRVKLFVEEELIVEEEDGTAGRDELPEGEKNDSEVEPTAPPYADEALEELEMNEFMNNTVVDDNNTFSADYFSSGEELGSGEFSGSGDESGWGDFSGSGEISYDPLCDGDCAKNGTVTVETELVKIEQEGSEGRDELGEEEEDESKIRVELAVEEELTVEEEHGTEGRDELPEEEENDSKEAGL